MNLVETRISLNHGLGSANSVVRYGTVHEQTIKRSLLFRSVDMILASIGSFPSEFIVQLLQNIW